MKKHRRPLDSLVRLRENLLTLVFEHETGADAPMSHLAVRLEQLAVRLSDRMEAGPEAPVIIAILGATGTGKSKIFNSLAGSWISPSGFKRPTTMAPVIYAADKIIQELKRDSFFPGYKKCEVDGEARFDGKLDRQIVLTSSNHIPWANLVLVDTPDFDSVLEENRIAAAYVFQRCDAVVFVTDAVKYADQASWDYLEKIQSREKQAVFIVNRVKNVLSLEDFNRRLAGVGLERTVLSLPDYPDLSDRDPLPDMNETLISLKELLTSWNDAERLDILICEAEKDWLELENGLFNELIPGLKQADSELTELRQSLNEEHLGIKENLLKKLSVSISGELKNSLISQIQELFLKWDLLRYPRRVMAVPFSFIKDKVLVPLGVMNESSGHGALDREIDRLFEANCETIVAEIHELNRLAAELFHVGPVGRGLVEKNEFNDLVFFPELVRNDYRNVRTELEKWVEAQARELVKDLNLGEKMTFYLAQVVSLGLFISIQVHTGGGFSFFDGLLDGALAPLLSKIAGSALSRDKVKAFEAKAVEIHLQGCQGIIDRQADAYLQYLSQAENGLGGFSALSGSAEELVKAFETLK